MVNKGQSIDTFLKLRDELNVFFTDHHFQFLTRLAYLGDVFPSPE
jgi:hypothetical protein